MIVPLLIASALRSTLLGLAVGGVLAILRVRRPEPRMAAWSIVLSVAVLTPALAPWMRISVPLPTPPASTVWNDAAPSLQRESAVVTSQLSAAMPTTAVKRRSSYGNLQIWILALYAAGAGAMVIRILFGLVLTLLLVRESTASTDRLLHGMNVRESRALKSPATLGSTIFLPADYRTWSDEKCRAVLLHEGSHVGNRDFYVLLVASFYRAAFWFNPFAWWLEAHLTNLAEMIADDAAAQGVGDRRRYAAILTDLARRPQRLRTGLAMAAPGAVDWRIQRQMTATLPLAVARQGQRLVIASVLFPLALLSAATLTRTVSLKPGTVTADVEQSHAFKDDLARRAATTPGRFLRQSPLPRGEAALREELASLCCRTPPYAQIGTRLSTRLQHSNSLLHAALERFGAPRKLTFVGVGPGGYDIYDVQFQHGSAEARIDIAPGGMFEDLALNPGGDETRGGLVGCAQETSLVLPHEPVFTSLTIANRSGAAIELFDLVEVGQRKHRATLPEGGKTNLWTGVQQPLLVSNTEGRCLGIILPGQSTRANFIGPGGTLGVVRQTAFPGGSAFLRQYVDGIRQGNVLYDRITPKAAATLRQQEQHRRAILEQLGILEDLRFEGVSGLDEDIYRARFTHGSCEWRISFEKDGRISGIELSPILAQDISKGGSPFSDNSQSRR